MFLETGLKSQPVLVLSTQKGVEPQLLITQNGPGPALAPLSSPLTC